VTWLEVSKGRGRHALHVDLEQVLLDDEVAPPFDEDVRLKHEAGERCKRAQTSELSASSGTGTKISTLFAVLRRLNWPLTFTRYSKRLPRCASTAASTHTSGLTGVEIRKLISSNSPSGGMNEIVRSLSKRVRRTHWWNLTSPISIAFPRDAAACACQHRVG
jgi:hypothetical protein